LHPPLGISESAIPFSRASSGQNYVGQPGRFGQEKFLHHQKIQLFQRGLVGFAFSRRIGSGNNMFTGEPGLHLLS
jgi:hypothetical protein